MRKSASRGSKRAGHRCGRRSSRFAPTGPNGTAERPLTGYEVNHISSSTRSPHRLRTRSPLGLIGAQSIGGRASCWYRALDGSAHSHLLLASHLGAASAGGESKKVTLFDATSWTRKRELVASGNVIAVAIDDHSTIVAAAVERKGVDVFDARSGAHLSTIAGDATTEWNFGMIADGKRVFLSNARGEVASFESRTGRPIASVRCDGLRRFVVERASGRVALLRGRDPSVEVWGGARATVRLDGAPERVRTATLFADGTTLAIVEDESPEIVVLDLRTGSVRTTLRVGLDRPYAAIPSADGSLLFVAGHGESVIVDAKTGREQRRFARSRWSAQHEAAWGASGQLALVGPDDHTLQLLSPPTLSPLPPMDIGSPVPTRLAYSYSKGWGAWCRRRPSASPAPPAPASSTRRDRGGSLIAMADPLALDALSAQLGRRIGLDALWVFGSVARGTDAADSDLDLAALFSRRPAPGELLDVAAELAALAGRDVDLVDLDTASPILAMQALRHGRLLVDNTPRRRVAFASGLPSRYEDVVRLRRPAEEAILRRVTLGRS